MAHTSLQPVGTWLGESFGRLKGRLMTLAALFVFGCFTMILGVALIYALGVVFIGLIQGWDSVTRTLLDPRKL